jgi:outer membrane protein assembly factor BamA
LRRGSPPGAVLTFATHALGLRELRRATAACAVVACATPAHALEGCDSAQYVADVELEGFEATATATVQKLFPRSWPSSFTAFELAEVERRLNNLGIFDAVRVVCRGPALSITVREKWTLVPSVEFSTGKTLADTYALLGVTEYNFLGSANQLALSVSYQQRGFGATVGFNEHDYQRHGWSLGSELSVATAAYRFEADEGWRTTSVTLELSGRSPPIADYFNYVAGFYGSNETVHEVDAGVPPPSTYVLQSFMGFTFDAYAWHDLVPSGVQASLWFSIGGLFGETPAQPRHTAEAYLRGALPLGGRAVVVGRVEGVLGTRGNANYGYPLGSVGGVRGLPDAVYVNWAQVLANLELRQSFQPWERWALQVVGFADAAAFEGMTAQGGRGAQNAALSLGLGARVVPTWITSVVLRLDAARLLAPEPAWFIQLGLNQYF